MKSRINIQNGNYLSFPKIRKSGNKILFPIMFMKFFHEDDDRYLIPSPSSVSKTQYNINLPIQIKMENNRWKKGKFSSPNNQNRNQEIASYVCSVMQSVSDNFIWVEDHNVNCSNFCAVNFKSKTAIHVLNNWNEYRILRSSSDEDFHLIMKKFCLTNVRIDDPIEHLYIQSKFKESSKHEIVFKRIFTDGLENWLEDWCGDIIHAVY